MQNFPQSNEIFFGHVTADILAPFTYYHKGMLLYVAIVCTIQGSLRELYMYHQLSLLKISTPQIFHFLANTHRYLQSRRRATTFDNLSYNNFLPSDSHHKSQLGFIRDIEVAILPGLSGHTNVISFLSSVFFDIFFCSSEDDFPLFLLFLKWTMVYIQLKFIIKPDDLQLLDEN